jgi:Holliday junction resolvase-like predicted endonuclease
MRNKQAQTEILRYLYSSYCKGHGLEPVDVDSLTQDCGLDENAVWRELDLLGEENLTRYVVARGVRLTTPGILYVEDCELAAVEQVNENRQARNKILDVLAKTREESGFHAWRHWIQVASQADLDELSCVRNIYVLIDIGLAQWIGPSQDLLRITPEGLRQVNEWHQRIRWMKKYERLVSLEGLTPQERGHELERLLVQIMEADGWECELNVRGRGEEHDIVIHRDREYYLIECKWHKAHIEAASIREFRDRVSSRKVQGIFVSMSGYTEAALQDARERLSDCMVLLFGRKDVEALLSGNVTFTEFLNSKIDAIVKRREILVDATS